MDIAFCVCLTHTPTRCRTLQHRCVCQYRAPCKAAAHLCACARGVPCLAAEHRKLLCFTGLGFCCGRPWHLHMCEGDLAPLVRLAYQRAVERACLQLLALR